MTTTLSKRGFTLIELLVVIAIIGILSSVVLASLNTARERGANAKRLSDMRQIQHALELYASNNGGNYPNYGWAYACNAASWNGMQSFLAPYMPVLPTDPTQDCSANRQYYIISYSNTTQNDYKVLIHVPPNAASVARSVWDPTRDSGSNPAIVDGNSPWGWAVYTPGGAAW